MGENPNATGIETNCFTDTVWGIKPLARRTKPKKLNPSEICLMNVLSSAKTKPLSSR